MKLKPAFWILGGIIFLLLILTIVYGLPVPEERYNGVTLKFYDDKINKSKYYDAIDKINPVYFNGLRAIIIMGWYSGDYCGLYFHRTKVIYLFEDCRGYDTYHVLTHELAHHQGIRGHNRVFYTMLDKIENIK